MRTFSYRTAFLMLAAACLAHVATLACWPHRTPVGTAVEALADSDVQAGPAIGQTAPDATTLDRVAPTPTDSRAHTLIPVRIKGGSEAEALCVFRHADEQLAIYLIGNQSLEVMHLRSCSEDLSWSGAFSPPGSSQKPTPAEIRKLKKP